MSVRYLIGDVFERMAELKDGSVDLVLTSPPFLALRSYLSADHPDKDKEIGTEATPAEFIDVMLRLTAEWRRLLAPYGTICVELGDTHSGSGGSGGDYAEDGLREGQPTFKARHKDRPQDDDGGYQTDQRVQYDGQRAGIRNMNNKTPANQRSDSDRRVKVMCEVLDARHAAASMRGDPDRKADDQIAIAHWWGR